MLTKILNQKIMESSIVIETYLLSQLFAACFLIIFQKKHAAFLLFSKIHRITRIRAIKHLLEKFIKKNINQSYKVSSKQYANDDFKSFFGSRIMVLKSPENGEKGILYIMFSEVIQMVPQLFDMKKLQRDYLLVLEPSWSGYCDEGILQYTKYSEGVIILSAEEDDFRFIKFLGSNLIPVPLGPCDWVNPNIFKTPQKGKIFDVVMNSHWGPSKRHYVLFNALKKIDPGVKVALIGVPWDGGSIDKIKQMAKYYNVLDQITIFERIPYAEVMSITSQSKLGLLLSLKEGSNRAIAEKIFCDIPVIILEKHIGGIRKNVVKETGRIVREAELAENIEDMLSIYDKFSPRDWGLKNISCFETTNRLNKILKDHCINEGLEWTKDIAVRTNSPEAQYLYEEDKVKYQPFNSGLEKYLLNNGEC